MAVGAVILAAVIGAFGLFGWAPELWWLVGIAAGVAILWVVPIRK